MSGKYTDHYVASPYDTWANDKVRQIVVPILKEYPYFPMRIEEMQLNGMSRNYGSIKDKSASLVCI